MKYLERHFKISYSNEFFIWIFISLKISLLKNYNKNILDYKNLF